MFFKKDHLADLMACWVCRLHNLYFAHRSALFVRLALLYRDAFLSPARRSGGGGYWRRLRCPSVVRPASGCLTHPLGGVDVPFEVFEILPA